MDIKILCEIGHVSRSGYYKWLKDFDKPDKDISDYLIIKVSIPDNTEPVN